MNIKLISSLLLLIFTAASVDIIAQSINKTSRYMKIKSQNVRQYELKKDSMVQVRESMTEYNRRGQITKEVEFNEDGTYKRYTENIYKKGKKLEERDYDKSGKLSSITTFSYDNMNDKISESVTDSTGKIIEKIQYLYNSFGQKETEIHFNKNNEIAKKIFYTYDIKGSVVERIIKDGNGKVLSKRTYQYAYFD